MIRARTISLPVVVVALLAIPSRPAGAEAPQIQTMLFDQTITIDPLGDAAIGITLSLNATQYMGWQQKYGQNKALLKRDLSKFVSQYDTYNWDVQTNEMERRVTITMSAHGAVKHRGGGQYEFDVPKNWRGGQLRGNVVDYNYVESLGVGVVGQYSVKVVLPGSARNIATTTGESGEPVVRYQVPVRHHGITLGLFIPGVMSLLIGAGLIVFSLRGRRGRPAATALRPVPPPINLPTAGAVGRG